jgi:hypothetical protein
MNSRIIRYLLFAWIFCLAVVSSVPMRAQVTGATLSGTVTDPSGAVIPNAQLSIKNTATSVTRDVTTDSAGFYSAPNLSPGRYNVTVSAVGFTTVVQSNIELTVGAQQELNVPMKIGETTQTVRVAGAPPVVELASSAISAQVNSTTVRELPLNGRDWTSLAVLQPGVIGIRTQIGTTGTTNRGNRGFGNQLSNSGHRPTENNYRVNGISVNDYSNGAPGSVAGVQLGVDAIEEFSVLTANYTAEYGRTSGGVINAVARAGTNAFHGSAYWFLRDEGLDARNFFDATLPPFHRNQFGGSAGGPIIKDKTFMFGDFEAIRQDRSLTVDDVVPTAAARAGNLCSVPTTGTCKPNTLAVNPLVKPYLPFYPLPNAGLTPTGNGDTGFFTSSPIQQYSENYATARLDHKISDRDSLDAVWFFDRSPQTTPDDFSNSISETFSERVMGGLEETHTFSPTLVNTIRVGYNRTNGLVGNPVSAITPVAGDTTLGVVPNRAAPIITVSGLAPMQGSLGALTQNNHVQNSFQFYDDAFLTRGVHALKLGFAVERIQYNELAVQRPNGSFGFPSLQGFLLNQPSNILLGDPNNSRELGSRITFFGAYLQDDWHVRSNLTLNLGLRYEPATLPTEAHDGFSVVQNIYGGSPVLGVAHLWQRNQTLRNFDPRIGFSWDPSHNGKTAVRGSFGIFEVLPGPWESNVQESGAFPFALTVSAGGLPAGAFPKLNGVTLGATSFQAYAPDQFPKRNYAMNWNLNIQWEITRNLAATIGYVGSHTVHSPFTTDDSNMVIPTPTAAGDLWPSPVGSGTKLDPNVGQLRPTFWAVSSHYNALEAQITEKMSRGFQVQGSYTWSKCLDNSSSGDIGDPYTNSLSSLIFFESLGRTAPCDFNIGQNFVANWIWDVPSPKSASGIVGHLAGGWEVGGIITASTGSPFTVVIGGDPLGQNSSDPFDFPSRVTGCNPVNANFKTQGLQYLNLSCFTPPVAPASFASQCGRFPGAAAPAPSGTVYCANLFGNAGRNELVGPGLVDFDFSLFKNNYVRRVSETFNIQFRAEFFNVLNHANFQSPIANETLFNEDGSLAGGAGTLNTTSTDPRQIQFGLKVIW